MKRFQTYILWATAVLAVAACAKEQQNEADKKHEMILSVIEESSTKAMLDNETFKADGNRIMVYDIYTADASSAPEVYIEALAGPDVETESQLHTPGVTWPFEDLDGNPVTYTWPPYGTHRFFGWLANDANMSNLSPEAYFGSGFGFDKTTYKLTIPSKSITSQIDQFDFLYSNIITRDMTANADYNNVQLAFRHLFTAFSIGATNNMDSDITINEFKVVGLYNSTSAVIDFSGSDVKVTYGEYSQDYADQSQIFKQNTNAYTIGKRSSGQNVVKDIFTGSTTADYSLVWPQSASQVHSSQEPEELDGMITYPSDWKMYIKYTSDGATVDKWLNFPEVAWEAGKRYHFDVKFADKYIDIAFQVADWDHQSQVVDYSSETVVVNKDHRLLWREDTCLLEPETGYAYVMNGMPVRGRFQFDAPLGGTWMATLTGDIDAFTLSPESGVIDGNTANIAITPKPEAMESKTDLKVQVRFAVRRTDGRTIVADDMIQPENAEGYVKYTIVLPAN